MARRPSNSPPPLAQVGELLPRLSPAERQALAAELAAGAGVGPAGKAERDLLEAALAYGLALDGQARVSSAVAAKGEEAREAVDGAADWLLVTAQGYFLATQDP
jgi:hypothetical protein